MRYELTDYEWAAIKPFLPNKPGGVPRVMTGACSTASLGSAFRRTVARYAGELWPLHHPLQSLCPLATGRHLGRDMNALAATHDATIQMIDTSIIRVHQHAACVARNKRQSMGRSRGGLTSKIHAVVDTNGLPIRLALTA